MIEIKIHQTLPTSLVYYTIQTNNQTYDGDALTIEAALNCIKHDLEWNIHDEEENDY